MATNGRLAGRVAIVTGGGKGIGAVYTAGLAREGARVVAADIDEAAAEAQVARLRAEGADALAVRVDTADAASVEAMVRAAVDRFGGLDILVNNAALYTALLPKRPFWELDEAAWDRVLRVNVTGLWLCARAALPHLRASGRGRIINISSATVMAGTPGFLHYVSSKGAVIALTRAMAREVGDFNITVNAIAPGLTASETGKAVQSQEELERPVAQRCLKRVQVPEDLVGAVVFLASDAAAFITGQTLVVDGGAVFH
ncbi:MAG: 3-oxoacyl-ACP reductase FabG [Chloroflexi bacterium]|nr:3-oxoacyl-ACP reductase FabG [Chloroflexota bacterium]